MSEPRQNNQSGASSKKGTAPAPAKARATIVFGRWAIAVALSVVVVAASAFGVLSPVRPRRRLGVASAFLFANALWQHLSLGQACAVAFVGTVAVGGASVLVGQSSQGASIFDWGAVVIGAAIGVLVARSLLRKIDQAIDFLGNAHVLAKLPFDSAHALGHMARQFPFPVKPLHRLTFIVPLSGIAFLS